MPSTPLSAALHHIALGARDVERVAAFYREVLGLPEQQRHLADDGSLRSVWLQLSAEATLMIEKTDRHQNPPPFGVTPPGPFLLAFRIDESELRAFEARLVAEGSPIEGRTAHSSYARDPEGNRIAISFYPLPKGERKAGVSTE